MSASWSAYSFKRALAVAVAARSGISGLEPVPQIVTFLPDPKWMADAIIVGYGLTDDKEKVSLGGQTHDETVNIVCQIRVARDGGGEAVAQEAEDRANAILAEIDTELRENPIAVVGARIINPGIVARESLLFPTQSQDGVAVMRCVVEFTIRYRAKTTP